MRIIIIIFFIQLKFILFEVKHNKNSLVLVLVNYNKHYDSTIKYTDMKAQ